MGLQKLECELSETAVLEAYMAWLHYQETGLHLCADEVYEWLDRWGDGRESEISVCHR